MQAATARTPSATARRSVARVLCVLVGGLLLPELALRFLLFSELGPVARLAAPLRHAQFYAPPNSNDQWWLTARFDRRSRRRTRHPDPELGYLHRNVEFGTYRHVDEDSVGQRRALLLYGDSYAQCVTEANDCWQGLMEASDLGPTHRLLNYGAGGYGLDQAVLLLERSLARHAARDPLVLIGILVDDDLDRCALTLREYPKPFFELAGDELVLHPPLYSSVAEQARHESSGITSFVGRALLGASGQFERPWVRARLLSEAELELPLLVRRLLEHAQELCAAAGVELCFVLFHGPEAARTRGPHSWREPLLYRLFAELELPFVSSKRALWEAARTSGQPLRSFYNPPDSGGGRNHLSAAGNRAVFGALRAALARDYEPAEYLRGAEPPPDVR